MRGMRIAGEKRPMKNISDLLKKKIVLLDGATGTELQKRGLPDGACPEKWCLENPGVIQSIHSDYARAGSDIIYTCTFGANRFKLNQHNVRDIRGANRRLARLARLGAGEKAIIAGDIGPTGCFVKPFGTLDFEEAVGVFKEQAKGLLEGGVDIFAIETMMDIQEARAALVAVKELTDKFTIVSVTYEKDGRTLNGTDPLAALVTLQSLGADAVGCNCSTGPASMLRVIRKMKPYANVPILAKPNAGMPRLVDGKLRFDMNASKFASFGVKFARLGVNMIGGCCGTTPEYIYLLGKVTAGQKPLPPNQKSGAALSSARDAFILDSAKPPVIVGERINPTGKKEFQKELAKGKFSILRKMAKSQEKDGAGLLDVNVGMHGINEKDLMEKAVNLLAATTTLPLVIDSQDPKTVERALRVYPGRALVNSISGEKEKLKKLLPLAARYGAMFILLPLGSKGIPETLAERKQIIRAIFARAARYGFTKSDIIVDGLALAVSSNPELAEVTLATIKWCKKFFKTRTVVGLSNISFGMPNREKINKLFLELALADGLTMAIADPAAAKKPNVKRAKALLGRNKNNVAKLLGSVTPPAKAPAKKRREKPLTPAENVFRTVVEGRREDIKAALGAALNSGKSGESLIDEIMVPAITKVGELFNKRKYFLPQLIASAETMKKGFVLLEPHLKKKGAKARRGPTILLATVKGDVHDIGKNIVALMMKNHGFNIIDLGKDVSAARIVSEAKRSQAALVGLSALMTTTMGRMKDVIELAGRKRLKCKFIVGGAVISRSYAARIGSSYAADSVEAVKVARRLTE
jgi:5-methyltetrahydrofolate--homocysteine methyltransferase